jgi:hypothetical protein
MRDKGKRKKKGQYLKKKIPVGALVEVQILSRSPELAVVVECNYGLVENSWYRLYGIKTNKFYIAYPEEIQLLIIEKGDKKDD